MYERLDAVAEAACRLILGVCAALLVVMVATMAQLVFTRNALGFSYRWSEELTRYLMIWLVFLAGAVLTRRDDHIALTILPDALPARRRAGLMLALRAPILAALGLLFYQSWLVTEARATARSAGLAIPMSWIYAAIPVGAALMILFTLLNAWRDLRALRERDPGPG